MSIRIKFLVQGNCDKFYLTFVVGIQNWDQMYQIFKRNRTPICYLSNKLNPNTEKPNTFEFDWILTNICKRVKIQDWTIHNLSQLLD